MAAGLVGIDYSFNYYLVSGGLVSDLSSAALFNVCFNSSNLSW